MLADVIINIYINVFNISSALHVRYSHSDNDVDIDLTQSEPARRSQLGD